MAAATQIHQLLDEALALSPAQRASWFERLQVAPLVRERIRKLLERAHDPAFDFLNTLPKTECADEPLALHSEILSTAGKYQLIELIGRGGMGSVWRAERIDGVIKREVALKLPSGSWSVPALAERMQRERDILARLAHPNIARLYDAGITHDGQPFLALELVCGTPIDIYCSEHSLTLAQRLQLFLQIANAVAHAHAQLIVHRDLKPANVLVTQEGQVRLLDFGIAKLLEEDASHAALTMLTGRALTLDYASPEQIAGEPITIASDIYSLGVMLYELITGRRPWQSANVSRRALERAVLHEDPSKPSARIGDRSLRSAVRGDIDAIVLKALEKDPAQRYATVNAFADDISRFLGGRPVSAQPDRLVYRTRKLVARHRGASVAVALLIAVISLTAIAAVDIARTALADRKRLILVKDVFAGLFQEIDPAHRDGIPIEALERILSEAATKASRTLPQHDMLRSRLEMRLALVEHHLGRRERSRSRLNEVLRVLASAELTESTEYARAKLLEGYFALAERQLDAAERAALSAGAVMPADAAESHLITAEIQALFASVEHARSLSE